MCAARWRLTRCCIGCGFWYFTLKDEDSRINCVMFRQNNMGVSIRPADGMAVIVSGSVSLYVQGGAYQFYVDAMRPDGVGSLYLRYEALKAKLAKEGLFDAGRKRPLPLLPRGIAIVTSLTGAVLHDIRTVSARRNPAIPLTLLPVRVQGEGAAEEIAAAIRKAGTLSNIDVLITGRGGGSMEDLWAFNDERVARAIYASEIPVISAVGHEPDVTISDYVADLRAATPSNAAELAVPDRQELLKKLSMMQTAMQQSVQKTLKLSRQRLNSLAEKRVLQSPLNYVEDRRVLLDFLSTRLHAAGQKTLHEKKQRFVRLTAALDAMSPLKVLSRGYSMVTDETGTLVTSAGAVTTGQRIHVSLRSGSLTAQVEQIQEEDKNV